MAAPNTISIDKLVRLIGTPKCPVLVDVRAQDDFDADPHLIPLPSTAPPISWRIGLKGTAASLPS